MSAIQFFDRGSQSIQEEKVAGESAIRFVYENAMGRFIRKNILIGKRVSRIYGAYQSTRMSARAIQPFIENFKIEMSEFDEGPFSSFNDFFIRKFKPGKRLFQEPTGTLSSFAEGRYFGFESVSDQTVLPVKNVRLSISQLIQNEKWSKIFMGGPILIARLCPVDYHRYHFPDSGSVETEYQCRGPLESVNPIALHANPNILMQNERQVTILNTDHFGRMAYIEVGALCVGKIVNTYSRFQKFKRGDEKGYFLFGGSTVILVGEPGAFRISGDILAHTQKQVETRIQLGDEIAKKE